MSAARGSSGAQMTQRLRVTMLELVQAVQGFARTDAETVAVITHLVNSGRVCLGGNFAGVRIPAGCRQVAH